MRANDFQKSIQQFIVYGENGILTYPLLGLVGEVGEVFEKVLAKSSSQSVELDGLVSKCMEIGKLAKRVRDKGETAEYLQEAILACDKEELVKELGDTLFMIFQLLFELGVDAESVLDKNYNKLYSRLVRGKISGDGDNR